MSNQMQSTYPIDDSEFREVKVQSVEDHSFTDEDGWSFYIDKSWPVRPRVGATVRFYGRGPGFPVRGLFIDGERAFYRNEEEEAADRDRRAYGASPSEWLARWDSGKSVWSVSMGGLGPGYEQCIQIMAAEMLRILVTESLDTDKDWPSVREKFDKMPCLSALSPSGAQFGAAANLACVIYNRGPIDALNDPSVKERLIQVSKDFPSLSR